MQIHSDKSGAAVMVLSFDEAVAILRSTADNAAAAGMFSKAEIARQELRIDEVATLQAIVQRFADKVPVGSVPTDAATQVAIQNLRLMVSNRFNSGMATMRDVAQVELRLTEFATRAALAYQLSEMQGIPFVAKPVAGPNQGLEWAQATLLATLHSQVEAGEADLAEVDTAVLEIAEAHFQHQIAYGS